MKKHTESVLTTQYTFTAVFEPVEEGGYVVHFPALGDLATQGETLGEAREMAVECVRGYLETLQELGRPLPDSESRTTSVFREEVKVNLYTV